MLCKIDKFLFNINGSKLLLNRLFTKNSIKMSIDIGDMRTSYRNKREAFLEEDIPVKDPIAQFKLWFDQVRKNPNVIEPNAVCLATATRSGIPSARYVLLKGYGPDGFTFFTNYGSRKGKELEENPNAALTFYWDVFNRSVRVEGVVEKLDLIDADAYFHRRPKQSQIGACVSNQSQIIEGRHVLVEKELELTVKYRDCEVPRPLTWGGYIVIPHTIEFWQGQTDRLHDRIRFRKLKEGEELGEFTRKGEGDWVYERLAP